MENPLGYGGAIAEAYALQLRSMYTTSDSWSLEKNYGKFKNVVAKYSVAFKIGNPQDANEFLMFLIYSIDEDLRRLRKRTYYEKPTFFGRDYNAEMIQDLWENTCKIEPLRHNSKITELFDGFEKHTIECEECHFTSIEFVRYTSLSLPLPFPQKCELQYDALDHSPVALEQCMIEYRKQRRLFGGNEWYCSQCKTNRQASASIELQTAPEYLLLYIKRFPESQLSAGYASDFGLAKAEMSETPIVCPKTGLDLQDLVNVDDGKVLLYDPVAIINRDGTQRDGSAHYTAFAMNFLDQKWYEYDGNF